MKKYLLLLTLIMLITGRIFAQKQVTGQVLDETGQPVPGATVIIKGTTQGTITNLEGNYTIADVPDDGILVFSFLGMETKEVTVGDRVLVNVTLVEEATDLDEVVIVGYGGVKRANLTGAVVDMKASDIEDIPVANLSTALQGRLAGVKVGQATGKPGAATSLQIRTTTSYGKVPEEPIFVIDGVIYDYRYGGQERFDLLDPSEIESISVLKDASAAVYGTRASGGVILVTTKRGKEGKPKIKYNASYGISQPIRIPEMLSAYEHASMINHIYDIDDVPQAPWDYFAEDELEHFKTHEYDWLDGIIKNAHQTRHTLNVSGGSERVRYFAGGSYYYETGNLDKLNVTKYSLRTNIDADITKNITASLGISLGEKKRSEPYYSEESNDGVMRDTYKALLTAPRWIPPTIDGKPVYNDRVHWNPYGLMQSGSFYAPRNNYSTINGGLEYRLPYVEGLKFRVNYSYDLSSSMSKRYSNDYEVYNFQTTGTWGHIITDTLPVVGDPEEKSNREGLQEGASNARSYQLNTSITYAREFGKHDISALLVYEQSENRSNGFSTRLTYSELQGYEYMWAFNQNNIKVSPSANESGRLAYIGRLNYGYDQKYLVEGTFRYEASEVFHPDERWGFFPAISAGWVMSEESFFKDNISFINFLKVRASAGVLGNDNTKAWQWMQTYNANTTGAIFGETEAITNAIEPRNSSVITPSLTWQKSNSFNGGLDMRFLDSRISFGMDVYYRLTYDILTDRGSSIPITAGIANMPDENWGMMFAKGIEFELGYNDRLANGIGYFVKGVFSWDKHRKVRVFQNPAAEGRWDDQRLNDISNQPGWICVGIIRTQEELDAILEEYPDFVIVNNNEEIPPELGMLNIVDFRGENYSIGPDGRVDKFDKVILAEHTTPPYNYGFTFGGSWKGVRLDITFAGEFGHKAFVSKDEQVVPDAKTNVFSWWSDYWTPENPDAAYPRPYKYGLMKQHSTFWMRDGHTLRLSNLNLSYSLPGDISERWKIPELRVFFSTNNLWTVISPFDYKDPSVSRSYDYPMMRTYNFGLGLTL